MFSCSPALPAEAPARHSAFLQGDLSDYRDPITVVFEKYNTNRPLVSG